MTREITLVLFVIIAVYLLGSIPSAYIVGRLLKGIDMRHAGDGRIGAAATLRRVGRGGMIIVGLMDVSKGVAAILLSQNLGLPLLATVLAGFTVVVGHNWSIFLHFMGGKGALTTYGVLMSLIFWPFFIALAIAGVSYFTTHKTGMSTGVLFGSLSFINWITGSPPLISILPILISIPMVLKHISMPKAAIEPVVVIEGLQSNKA
ncbi:glycerol-3-phosphate acyltransferase [Chloroflexota bacterium]